MLEDQDARPHRSFRSTLILLHARRISRPWPITPPSPTPPASSRRSSRCSTTGATRSSTSSSSARTCRRCPSALKTEGNKVRGCQSQVWLVAEPEAGRADPPARRQRRRAGQGPDLAAAAASTTGARRRRSWTTRPTCWSGSGCRQAADARARSNGLYAMVARIRAMAEAFADGARRPEGLLGRRRRPGRVSAGSRR